MLNDEGPPVAQGDLMAEHGGPVHHPQPLKIGGALWCGKDGGDALSSSPRNPTLRSACPQDIPSVPLMEGPPPPCPGVPRGPERSQVV